MHVVFDVIAFVSSDSEVEGDKIKAGHSGDVVAVTSSDNDGGVSSDEEYARDIAAVIDSGNFSSSAASALKLPPHITSRIMRQRSEWR